MNAQPNRMAENRNEEVMNEERSDDENSSPARTGTGDPAPLYFFHQIMMEKGERIVLVGIW